LNSSERKHSPMSWSRRCRAIHRSEAISRGLLLRKRIARLYARRQLPSWLNDLPLASARSSLRTAPHPVTVALRELRQRVVGDPRIVCPPP
jgi:hypothetical protein